MRVLALWTLRAITVIALWVRAVSGFAKSVSPMGVRAVSVRALTVRAVGVFAMSVRVVSVRVERALSVRAVSVRAVREYVATKRREKKGSWLG